MVTQYFDSFRWEYRKTYIADPHFMVDDLDIAVDACLLVLSVKIYPIKGCYKITLTLQ